jgi:hypothetical protein
MKVSQLRQVIGEEVMGVINQEHQYKTFKSLWEKY